MIALRKSIIIIALFTLLWSCSDSPQDTGVSGPDQDAVESGGPDQTGDITIGPVNATAQTVITLRTGNPAINGGEIRWYVNSREMPFAEGFRLIPDGLKKGDVVHAVLVNGDKEYPSNEIRIKNTPPVIVDAALLPAMPASSDILRPEIKVDDVDGDTISFSYHWTLNGNFAGEESYLQTELKRDDSVSVEVTPHDGEVNGRSVTLTSSIFNSLPTVSESAPSFDGKTYIYRIAGSDPDNDTLTYKIEEGPEGMTIDSSSGIVTWDVGPDTQGTYAVTVSVSDNNGGTIHVPFTTKIGP